jgi:hypothetical protein
MTKVSAVGLLLWYTVILSESVRTKAGHCIRAKKLKLAPQNKKAKEALF